MGSEAALASSEPRSGGGSGADNQAASTGLERMLDPRRRAQLLEAAASRAAATRRSSPPRPPSPPPASKPRRRPPPPPTQTPRPKLPPSPRPPPTPTQTPRPKLPPSPRPPPTPTQTPRPNLPPSPRPPPPPTTTDGRRRPPLPQSASRVCAAVILTPPVDASGAPTYTYGKPVSCDFVAQIMIDNMTEAARVAGAAVAVPFAMEQCTGAYVPTANPPELPHILICGAFASDDEAHKLQFNGAGSAVMSLGMAHWQHATLGWPLRSSSLFCPPKGFRLQSAVWSEVPGVLGGYTETGCSADRYAPSSYGP